MSDHSDQRLPRDSRAITSFSVVAARVAWLFAGPCALVFILYGIATTGNGWTTGLDAAFFATLGFIVFCRWREQGSGQATTADGQPATWDHFRRYVRGLLPLAVGAWVVANVLGNHILNTPAL